MGKRLDYTLTAEQLGELEQAINSSPYPEVRQLAIAIRLLHLGQTPEQVATAVMVTSKTLYSWHNHRAAQAILGRRPGARACRAASCPRKYSTSERAGCGTGQGVRMAAPVGAPPLPPGVVSWARVAVVPG